MVMAKAIAITMVANMLYKISIRGLILHIRERTATRAVAEAKTIAGNFPAKILDIKT